MLEAKLDEAGVLKKLLDAIKELVTDANFECTEEGLNLQAMDNSHVALVSVKMNATGFRRYRCDRPMPLGVNLGSLTKVLRCAKDDDTCTLKAADEADVLNLVYEARNSDRIAEYEMKLMDIDSDQLGIPDTDYDSHVIMPAAEFGRIVRDLSLLGESVRIEVSKEGVRFAADGESANGSVLLKQSGGGEIGKVEKDAKEEDEEDEKKEDGDEDEEETEVKKEKKSKVKKEKNDEDVEMDEEEEAEDQPESEDEEDGDSSSKKRKKSSSSKSSNKRAKTTKSKKDEEFTGVKIAMNQHVALTFSLKYLVNFSKSASLTQKVELRMSNDVPLLVSYRFEQGEINYYLAPKIGDE